MSIDYFEKIQRIEKPWSIGIPISFGNMDELHRYEDTIRDATDIGNSISQDVYANWEGRKKLKEFLTIPKFNGRLLDIQLIPIETDPDVYDILCTQQFYGGGNKSLEDTVNNTDNVNGFIFQATAHSTGRGIIGMMNSCLVYAPAPSSGSKNSKQPTRRLSAHPIGLRRFVSKPTINLSKHPQAIIKESASIAEKDRRYALRRTFKAF